MSCGVTNIGGTYSISATAQNSDVTLSDISGISFTAVPGLVNHGSVGISTNMVTDPTWDDIIVCQSKGQSSGGSPTLEFRDQDSSGMDALIAAAAPDNTDNYVHKLEWPDGSLLYWRGPIGGPEYSLGGPEDNQHVIFTGANNQVPIKVAAST